MSCVLATAKQVDTKRTAAANTSSLVPDLRDDATANLLDEGAVLSDKFVCVVLDIADAVSLRNAPAQEAVVISQAVV